MFWTLIGLIASMGIMVFVVSKVIEMIPQTPRPLKTNDKLCNIILVCLGLGALIYLFRGLFNPSLVLFSNDGPYGVMQSAWLGDSIKEGPGTPMWMDTYWLGQNNGSIPVSFTYIFFWFCNNPFGAIFTFVTFFTLGCLIAEYKYQWKRLKNVSSIK